MRSTWPSGWRAERRWRRWGSSSTRRRASACRASRAATAASTRRPCRASGTQVVGGTRPGKGGTTHEGFAVFDTVAECREATGANTSVIYVPATGAAEAVAEGIEAGLELIVCITEGVPVLDMVRIVRLLEGTGTRLVGPNCPGVIRPGVASAGIIPGRIAKPGPVGVVSRSGTLTYEIVDALTRAGVGQSTCVGIGGDPVAGTNFLDCLALFRDDPETEAVVLIGEIGGSDEQLAAQFIAEELGKPTVAFVAGRTAPAGKRMGHAGAIISGGEGTAAEKVAAFEAAGVPVGETPEPGRGSHWRAAQVGRSPNVEGEPFTIAIDRLQPSQLYVSAARLRRLSAAIGAGQVHRVHPVPVKQLGGDLVLTDGHTRVFAAWQAGETEVTAIWETDELDWEAYGICVAWCRADGIRSVADLAERVVEGKEFERLWLDRCRAMHRELAARREGK